MRPSFLGLVVSGVLILISIVLIFQHWKSFKGYEWIVVVLLLSIATSAHSIQHEFEEIFFKFNPLIGEWKPLDKPQL